MKTTATPKGMAPEQLQAIPTSSATRILKEMEWLEDFQFMKKECDFFGWLIQENIDSSNGRRRMDLQMLKNRFKTFQATQIAPGTEEIRKLLRASQNSRQAKRNSFANVNHLDQFRDTYSRIKSAREEFRKLKQSSFNLIDRFMNFQII